MRIVLGSQSPRRKKLLNEAGYVIEVLPAHFDEASIRHNDPVTLTQSLARAKNETLKQRVSGAPIIITADTVVVFEGDIFEKASSEREAYEWISQYQGKSIRVVTSHMIYDMQTDNHYEHTSHADILFHQIPEDTRLQLALNAYNASVAGGFHMSDPLLRPYVTFTGSESVILGLDIGWVQSILISIEKVHVRNRLREVYYKSDLSQYVLDGMRLIEQDAFFQEARTVYAYKAIPRLEIPFIQALMEKYPEKKWLFPIVEGDSMHFTKGFTEKIVEPSCMLVPALALEPRGGRLGKGKGFYDAFLAAHTNLQVRTISIVPDFALLPSLPIATHDISITKVYCAKQTR
ncbi:MAG: hypothetical protein RI911_823 [Candidatus Parcubacteria bacterium]|jgi:septum formation protein